MYHKLFSIQRHALWILIYLSFCCFFAPFYLVILRLICTLSFSFIFFNICFFIWLLFLSIALSIASLSLCSPCTVVSRACVYGLRNLSTCSSWAELFFSCVRTGPNANLHFHSGQSVHTSTSGSPHPVKKAPKNFKNNYASVECGAKILSANSEAKVRHTSPLSLATYTHTTKGTDVVYHIELDIVERRPFGRSVMSS